ncbi:hypothetical protein FRB96_005498 [Tulasnella sp. 330]|nr:hypothetical protein FRB96_005498 [Tulasnella sp. 330]KAG8877402.1 hypothetical protein FRB97_003443 [Tulasnella sp. 331]KAG8884171.1 hypothetical protein FRB98_002587 [Tulasnella sp. 332]
MHFQLLHLLSILGTLYYTSNVYAAPKPTPRPLVIWHGMGDSAHSEGMLEFIDMIKEVHPGIFVHSVYISEKEDDDRKAGFFGKVEDQLELVYEQLNAVEELESGFDAIGFSQGGQFLRAYVQLYNSPPMHNLITFGSQHMGVSELPNCKPYDVLCRLMFAYGKGRVYTNWVQANVVPAQYFRDTTRYATYLQRNHWLPTINNEIASSRNETYAKNFATLDNLVLVVFSNDTTVTPKESGWFESYEITSDVDIRSEPLPLVLMRDQPLYKEDWIGLRTLDERGAVVRLACNGPHMHISTECWRPLVLQYIGGVHDPAARPLSPLIIHA